MSFLLRWLGFLDAKPASLAVRPTISLTLELPYGAAFARALVATRDIVGATLDHADESTGEIDASFGLINSERIAIRLLRVDDAHTSARIESRRPAGTTLPQTGAVLTRLERYLRTGA